MAKSLIIVDSCVFIKAFRKDARAKSDLKKLRVVQRIQLLLNWNYSREQIPKQKKKQYYEFLNRIMVSR